MYPTKKREVNATRTMFPGSTVLIKGYVEGKRIEMNGKRENRCRKRKGMKNEGK